MAKHVYHWKHGWIPLDHVAAKEKGAVKVEYRHNAARPHAVTAHIDGERVGEMAWHEKDGHIVWVSVYDAKNRRKGIAAGMLEEALKHDPRVKHNLGGGDGLTADGKHFADATPIPGQSRHAPTVTHLTPLPKSDPTVLDRFSDAALLAEITKYRRTNPSSATLRILLREAFDRGLDTRGSH